MTTINLQQATVPVTALMAVVVAGMGWWVNAQEADVKEVQAEVKQIQTKMTEQRVGVVEDIADIKMQQAVDSQKVEAILETLREIRANMREPE